jgi:hypothetical protein
MEDLIKHVLETILSMEDEYGEAIAALNKKSIDALWETVETAPEWAKDDMKAWALEQVKGRIEAGVPPELETILKNMLDSAFQGFNSFLGGMGMDIDAMHGLFNNENETRDGWSRDDFINEIVGDLTNTPEDDDE